MAQKRGKRLTVFCSGGMWPVVHDIIHDYRQMSGVDLNLVYAASMGPDPTTKPKRLANNEKADVLIMFDDGMNQLKKKHWIDIKNRVPLARSYIGMAVPPGTNPAPIISTPEKLKDVLLKARHVVYSDSSSGELVSKQLFKKLGIESEMKGKCEEIHVTPVGDEMGKMLASGKADIGFQHLSELRGAREEIRVVGLIPHSLQKTTLFSAVPVKNSANPTAAFDFIQYLASDEVALVIATRGLMPVSHAMEWNLKRLLDTDFDF